MQQLTPILRRRAERGQAIVLLSVCSLILAATLLTTFSVGKAIHERIAVQQAADASAYSLAVEESRAFNYYAYTNRAIVSHYVAVMAIYGHMSYALAWDGYLNQDSQVWCDQIEVELDVGVGCLACGDDPFCWAICMACAWTEAEAISGDCDKVQTELQSVDQQVGKGNGGNGPYIDALYHQAQGEVEGKVLAITAAQTAVSTQLKSALSTPANFTKPLAQQLDSRFDSKPVPQNLTGITASGPGGAKTAAGYCDAVADAACGGANVYRTQVSASNASRDQPETTGGDFTRDRQVITSPISLGLVQAFEIDGFTRLQVLTGSGMSRMARQNGQGDPQNELHQTGEAETSGWRVAAHDHGDIFATDVTTAYCGGNPVFGFSQVNVYAYSTPTNNPKNTLSEMGFDDGSTVQSTLDLGGCTNPNDANTCGLLQPQSNFRISTANPSELLFNQPRTFAVIEENFTKATWGPFGMALTKFAPAVAPTAPGGKVYNNLVNDTSIQGRESILGVSSGLAYYHRPGSWREPPNFYNPYWRAKLHPFNSGDEISQVVKSAGYTGNNGTDFIAAMKKTEVTQ